jgi:tetratricopeptide (TPR) repeat protein
VLLITMLLYLRCLGNSFVFDDHEMIVLNRYIGQWSFLWRSLFNDSWWFRDPLHLPQSSYYRPLQDIWLAIHYQLFGLIPGGWHATMVVLHLLAVWLVFRIAGRVCGDWRTALLTATLFGLIPIHAEAVVWPTAIPLPLSATLELASLHLFICRAGAFRRNWIFSLVLYAGALFTHESAVVFPALVGLYVFLIEAPPSDSDTSARVRRTLRLVMPFAVEMLVYLLVRYQVLGFINRPNPENHATVAQALMTVPPALATYLGLLLMPWLAGPSHRLLIVTSPSAPELWLSVALLSAAAGAFFLMLRNDPRRRLCLLCGAWIVVAVIPMMNLRGLFHQGLIQDRYLYLSSVGWCMIVADMTIRLADTGSRSRRLVACGVVGLLIAVYAAALWRVQGFWHDEVALFTRCIEKFPESAIWHNRLGMALQDRGDLTGAEQELSASLKLDPQDGATLYDLGMVHARLGRLKDAAAEVARGLGRLPYAPAEAYVVLARLYDASGDSARSAGALRLAESLPGGAEPAGFARATIKMDHGENAAAEEILIGLSARYPNNHDTWAGLGAARAAQNHYADAYAAFQRALALFPRDPQTHFYAARVLHKLGRNDEALDHCRSALELNPNHSGARDLMAEIARDLPKD